jgi:CheY-like chemotaxis protein
VKVDDKNHVAVAGKFVVNGTRVMVVEDEALVAMVESDALIELGYEVAGPFSRPPEALEAVKDGGLAAAILDINLGGTLVYPVAEELAARGIPFVFVTGYGTESIDRRFANVPVLQKPIDRDALQRIFVNGAIAPPAAAVPHASGAPTDGAQAATA